MAIDLDRVATTAIETTLNGGRRRRRGRPVARTLAAGAALYAAVRVGQKGAPTRPLKLMKVGTKTLGEFRELSDVVRNRLFERGEDYEEPADGEDEDGWEDEPDDDEPRGEGDDWAEDEDEEPDEDEDEEPVDDEPVAEEPDEDEDEEPVDDEPVAEESDQDDEVRGVQSGIEGGRQGVDPVPDLLRALGSSRRRPPAIRNGSNRVDPASQPPEPSKSKSK